MFDFDEVKKTEVEDKARSIATNDLKTLLINHYGEENVSQVGNSKLSVCLGLRTLVDGTKGEVCVEVAPVVKNFDVKIIATTGKEVEVYERIRIADDYAETAEKNRIKAEEAARKKAELAAKKEKAIAERKAKKAAEAKN